MAIKSVTYGNSRSYIGVARQPLGDLLLIGPTANISIRNVLVDTGADHLQVPAAAATAAGWLLSSGTSVSVKTVGGTITMTMLARLPVEIQGTPVTLDVLCHPIGSSRPLLGRSAILALSEVGFDPTDWLWQ